MAAWNGPPHILKDDMVVLCIQDYRHLSRKEIPYGKAQAGLVSCVDQTLADSPQTVMRSDK